MGSDIVHPILVSCPVCGYLGDGPSDHEPWCDLFMVGPVAMEGQASIFDLLEPADA